MNYRLVVFDFDGTLADSMASSIEIFRTIGPKLGLKPFDDLHAARNMSTRKLMREVGVSLWKLPKVVKAFQAAAALHAPHLKLHAGIAEALAALNARGIRLGILSSNREDNIRKCLAANGVEDLFSFVIGHPQLFGKARALRKIRKSQKLRRDEMCYVGDESRDVDAAKKVGIAIAAVSWGYHSTELLGSLEPTLLLRDPGELMGLGKGEPPFPVPRE